MRSDLERELNRLRRSMGSIAASAEPVTREQTCVGRLSRMDEGRYGICEKCGDAIPYGRLLVMPEARNCAGCEGA